MNGICFIFFTLNCDGRWFTKFRVSRCTWKYVLQKYKLDSVYSKLREGVYTNAGVHGGNLSLGMQKVTILLRGLFRKSKIVVLDEPLAGLDANTRVKIMNLIKDRCQNKTLIVITHDKEIIPYMDRVENLTGPPK